MITVYGWATSSNVQAVVWAVGELVRESSAILRDLAAPSV